MKQVARFLYLRVMSLVQEWVGWTALAIPAMARVATAMRENFMFDE
jgi:hypothetical protein